MENKIERMKMIKAMEFIARNVNNEQVFNIWLADGIGDGEIEYGDLNVTEADTEGYYCGGDGWEQDEADEHFADLMDTFMFMMDKAYKNGGLYCGDVCGGEKPHKE